MFCKSPYQISLISHLQDKVCVEAALVDIHPPHLVARLVCATAAYCRIGGVVVDACNYNYTQLVHFFQPADIYFPTYCHCFLSISYALNVQSSNI